MTRKELAEQVEAIACRMEREKRSTMDVSPDVLHEAARVLGESDFELSGYLKRVLSDQSKEIAKLRKMLREVSMRRVR